MATEIELLELNLSQLSKRLRCAVAAECAERVLPIFYFYEDQLEDDHVDPELAINLIWDYAETEEVNADDMDSLYKQLEEMAEPHKAEESALFYSIAAIASAVSVTQNPSIEDAKWATLFALDAVQHVNSDESDKDYDEENAFQKNILLRASSWGDSPITRLMFKDLSETDPQWESKMYEEA